MRSADAPPEFAELLQPWQRRVVDEFLDVDGRLLKLQQFLRSEKVEVLAGVHIAPMCRQERAMDDYADALAERIMLFEGGPAWLPRYWAWRAPKPSTSAVAPA